MSKSKDTGICKYAWFFDDKKFNKLLRCWPDVTTVEGSGFCKKHLMRQEVLDGIR